MLQEGRYGWDYIYDGEPSVPVDTKGYSYQVEVYLDEVLDSVRLFDLQDLMEMGGRNWLSVWDEKCPSHTQELVYWVACIPFSVSRIMQKVEKNGVYKYVEDNNGWPALRVHSLKLRINGRTTK